MTKTNKKTSNTNQHRLPLYRRAWFLALIIILVIAAVVCAIIFFVKPAQKLTSDTSTTDETTSESSVPSPQLNDGQHENEDEPYSDPDQITTQYEGENPNRASDLSGNITYTDYANGVLTIGTMIHQYLSDGACELKLTGDNGNNYTASSHIFAAASTSACSDFNLNVVPGSYQIEIVLTSNDKQGTITGEVNL